jgi:excisionase family DNA binding protein
MQNPFELIDERLSRIENKLEFILNQLSDLETKPESDVFYTVQETAQFLKLSVPTIYDIIHKMEIPVHKRGKRVYFLKSDLIEYLKKGRQRSRDEIQEEAEHNLRKGKISKY